MILNQAEQYLLAGINIYPQYSAAWVLLGNIYLERKIYKEASDYYMNALAYNSSQAEALNKLIFTAFKLSRKNDVAAAIKAYKVLAGLQPTNKDHLIQLADQYSKNGQADTAIVIVNNLLAKDPGYAAGYSKLGEIFGRVYNDLPKSESYLLKAYGMDPKNTSTLENLAIVYGIKKEFPKSVEF